MTTKSISKKKSNTKPLCEKSKEILPLIDVEKPVQVYRNLHKDCLSVRQNGIVVCHATNVVLKDARFVVGKKGQQRVRDEKKKNVHAYVKGFVADARETISLLDFGWYECYYNPYTTDEWTETETGKHLELAEYVDLYCDKNGCNVLAFNFLYKGQKNA